ncbi:START domain protein [Natrialba magadii ATCC 43099]|uniref:Polyketide cyclase/dehydrase n=1 Tax=Natrialba magadii (strain ATCC 43099 / DSM 3394 / CCM 3739 / CIP 104546 / IAM 13178 / JCM 8861 / NBRC 102185 / NCIMB 2190 / MS3) TaxID=547559 RepID=D3SXE5_NATMM|nr:SRPBCC family protein [Natrialba magadii]ADD05894.1 START domain protein [Natrialba magadii ATCC 43099]ELY30599.1 polyketide cyclase/dehydrase [Natrialba magadii ATCC 43099]
MTVRVDRSFEVAAPPERVWDFIADPANRARSISVVDEYTVTDSTGRHVTWHLKLPIPLVRRTVTVETEDVTRKPPEYVKFVGKSTVLNVTGEHEIVETETGTRLDNHFVVDGKLPGVEQFFKRNLDDELENLRYELERDLQTTQ